MLNMDQWPIQRFQRQAPGKFPNVMLCERLQLANAAILSTISGTVTTLVLITLELNISATSLLKMSSHIGSTYLVMILAILLWDPINKRVSTPP